jgi:signal transduction histidine kinase
MLWAGWVVAVVLAVVAVQLYRRVRELSRERLNLQAELDRERGRASAVAVLEERARIARELHDVAAHDLSAIALQAAGGHDDPDRALRAIRREAEEAAAELRRALGVLGPEGAAAERAAQPGLAQLPELVDRARAAGMPVTLTVQGRARAVPPGLDVSAYRIVQEALAEVHRHGGGAPAGVRLTWRPGLLTLQVRDSGLRTVTEPDGLVAMRERARAHGGELEAARIPGGGFEIEARLPL